MTDEDKPLGHQQVARTCVRMIMGAYPLSRKPGLIGVIVVNECDASGPMLEIDASLGLSDPTTELGGRILNEFAMRLRKAIGTASREIAEEFGCGYQQVDGEHTPRPEDMS